MVTFYVAEYKLLLLGRFFYDPPRNNIIHFIAEN